MKKIIYLLLLPIVLAAFTSCTNEVDDVFGQSSAERVSAAITETGEVLASAENGWLMKYYCGADYGGYNVLCKFNKDSTVTVQSEIYGPTQTYSSHYSIGQSQGVVLSFDEHNPVFHYFSDPANPDGIGFNGDGMEGDFEFRVMSATPDSVIMVGKKHGVKIVMTPADNIDWNTFITDVVNMESAMTADGYAVVMGNDTIIASQYYHTFTITDPETGNDVIMSYIQTPTGFELNEPVTFMGKDITGFTYSDNNEWLNPADNSIKLVPATYAPYAEGIFYSYNVLGIAWQQTLEYSTITKTYRFRDLYASGYNYSFTVSSDGKITQVPNSPTLIGVSDRNYGPMSVYATNGSIVEGGVYTFMFDLTVSAGSFGVYQEGFKITTKY